MADTRGGEVRNIKSGGGGETTYADETVKKDDSSDAGDQWGDAFDIHGDVDFTGNEYDSNGSDGEIGHWLRVHEDVQFKEFLESIHVDNGDDDMESETTEIIDACGESMDSDVNFGILNICSIHVDNQDSGQDTSRLHYFKVAPFNVHGDDDLAGNDSYGGGGGTRDRGLVVGPRLEEESGSATAVAGGGIRIRRVPGQISADNGSERVVQRLEQESDNGGGRRGRIVAVGLEQERGGVTAGAGSGDTTQEVLVGIFGSKGSGGEPVVEKLKQRGIMVPVPVAVAVIVVVIGMAVTLMVMVVRWW